VETPVRSTCDDLWRRLHDSNINLTTPSPGDNSHPTFEEARRFFEQTPLRTINLKLMSEEEQAYLFGKGMSAAYLLRNLAKTIKRRYRDSRAFQLAAVRDGLIYAFCPFSGQIVTSSDSFLANLNTIFYRFQSSQVFYVAIASIGSGFPKSALYFPAHELIVTAGDPWGLQQLDLVELKARMVSNFNLCLRYLSKPEDKRRQIAVCIGFYHFAHHLWNELSGLHRLLRYRLLKKVGAIIVMREPLGAIEQLFPEISATKIKRGTSADELFTELLVNNYFAVRLGDSFVPRSLQARVYKAALDNCLTETLDKVGAARKTHSPLLWVGIRVDNRTWVDQAQGLARLLDSLHVDFPNLGVVFDGFSLPADRSDRREYEDIIGQENAVVDEVVANMRSLRRLAIVNIIGSSIVDAIVWANAIDFYVTPFGSLQHKVGWLANKPGLIHTNQTLLGADYIWRVIENAMVPKYVRASSVTDLGNVQRDRVIYKKLSDLNEIGLGLQKLDRKIENNPEFGNYSVEWQAIAEGLRELIRSRTLNPFPRKTVFVISTKRRLNNIIQWIPPFFDSSKV
jgi:hypothetical protein